MFGQLVMALLLHKMTRQTNIPLVYPVAMLEGKDLFYGAHVNTLLINYHFDDNTTLQAVINNITKYYKDLKNLVVSICLSTRLCLMLIILIF